MQSTLIAVGCNRLHKRDGSQVAFDADKIRQALIAAGKATGEYGEVEVEGLLNAVLARLEGLPRLHVEQIQDRVERVLMDAGFFSPCARTSSTANSTDACAVTAGPWSKWRPQ